MLFEKTNHKIPDYYYNGLFMSGIIVLIYSVYKELLLFIIIFYDSICYIVLFFTWSQK